MVQPLVEHPDAVFQNDFFHHVKTPFPTGKNKGRIILPL